MSQFFPLTPRILSPSVLQPANRTLSRQSSNAASAREENRFRFTGSPYSRRQSDRNSGHDEKSDTAAETTSHIEQLVLRLENEEKALSEEALAKGLR